MGSLVFRVKGGATYTLTREDELDHWYKMPSAGDGSPPTVFTDVGTSTSSRYNFTPYNVSLVSNGRTNGGQTFDTYDFNGTNAYATRDDESSLINSTMTITAWVKLGSNPSLFNYIYGAGLRSGGFDGGIQIYFSGDYSDDVLPVSGRNIIFGSRGWKGTSVSDTSASLAWAAQPAVDTWFHIACVLDVGNNLQKIYINGSDAGNLEAENGVKDPDFEGTHKATIGAVRYSPGNSVYGSSYLDAEISDFRIYSAPLSGSDITSIYNGDYEAS
jgi:hypothetical protein